MTSIYVEASMHQPSAAAGWAAVVARGDIEVYLSGSMWLAPGDPVVYAELGALQAALQAALARQLMDDTLRVEMRALGALSILRWVFPDAQAPQSIEVPKKIGRRVQDLEALYDLHDDVERAKLKVELCPVLGANLLTERVKEQARVAMEGLRGRRRIA